MLGFQVSVFFNTTEAFYFTGKCTIRKVALVFAPVSAL